MGFSGGTRFTIRLRHEGEKPNKTIGRFRFSVTRDRDPARNVKLPTRAERVLAVPAGQRTRGPTPDPERLLSRLRPPADAETATALRASGLLESVDLAQQSGDEGAGKAPDHPPVRQGKLLNPGKEVRPGVPSVLHSLPESDTPPDRLTLARWLVSPENPLVGRVTMNRLWADHFGRPLATTPENLGTQGERPTHPELLDWLATEFVDQKWSMKAMHRLMVTSAAYRQSSRMGDVLREKDPSNRFYARGPRFRMDAEMIRDKRAEHRVDSSV